jgi:hypothetical protein
MTQIDSYPQFVKFEVLARLLTLCRMAISIGGEEAIKILTDIVSSVGVSTLSFWGLAMRSVSLVEAVKALIRPVSVDMSSFTLHYAAGDDLDRFTQLHMQEIVTMRKMEQLFEFLFSTDFAIFQEQENLKILLRDFPNADPYALRNDPKRTFVNLLCRNIRLSTLAKLTDHREPTNELLDRVLPASVPHGQLNTRYTELMRAVNDRLHFPIPGRVQSGQPPCLLYMHPHIHPISSDTFVVEFLTTAQAKYSCGVSRAPSLISQSFSSFLHVMKAVLNFTYVTQIRAIRLPAALESRIGARFVIAPLGRDTTQLRYYYTLAHENSRPRDSSILAEHISANCAVDSFWKVRLNMVRSLAASAVFKILFAADYPTLDTFCFSASSGEVQLRSADLRIPVRESDHANFRLSPVISTMIGPSFKGEFILAFGATAQALTQHFDTLRAGLEVVLADWGACAKFDCHALIEAREDVENVVLKYCPPLSLAAGAHHTEAWLTDVNDLIDKAANPQIQPHEACPWF